ncbi:hypothetical protein C7424_3979 [Pantoea ananatis]|nr:hypothetical protein C7433_11087 [Pantoea sp. PNA 03-3]REE67554.1 hypothetical protein C7424_3979 [Pantoea ananatis]
MNTVLTYTSESFKVIKKRGAHKLYTLSGIVQNKCNQNGC